MKIDSAALSCRRGGFQTRPAPGAVGRSRHFHALMWPGNAMVFRESTSPAPTGNAMDVRFSITPRRACPVPRYGAGIHVPGPWIPAQSLPRTMMRGPEWRGAAAIFVALMWPSQGHSHSERPTPLFVIPSERSEPRNLRRCIAQYRQDLAASVIPAEAHLRTTVIPAEAGIQNGGSTLSRPSGTGTRFLGCARNDMYTVVLEVRILPTPLSLLRGKIRARPELVEGMGANPRPSACRAPPETGRSCTWQTRT